MDYEAPTRTLQEIVSRFGTPTYAFDVRRLRSQVETLHAQLPSEVGIYYSLKANASLGVCEVFADRGIGADVASAGEFATALAAGFPAEQIFAAGPYKLPETIAMLRSNPAAVASVDSLNELTALSDAGLRNRVVLRLRPDFGSCAVVPAGSESRFGFTPEALESCSRWLPNCQLDVIGFHVFAGSQILDADKLNDQLRRSLELSLRAAEELGIACQLINLGGGFGIPYVSTDHPLDLPKVGRQLTELVERAAPTRLMLELGRYLVADAGWYITKVLGHQMFQGRPAVVVDGGVHQRADMCGLCLRTNQAAPLVLKPHGSLRASNEELVPTDILGCLSLPDDVMLEASPLPELAAGDVLAFSRAGAYGLWSSPALFHGSPMPAEVAFDESELYLMRPRKPAQSILDDQHHVMKQHQTTPI